MSELRAGMMCLIISHKRPINIGKSVTLVHFVKTGDDFIEEHGTIGVYRDSDSKWLVSGIDLARMRFFDEYIGDLAFCSDKELMPLKGDTDFTQEEQLIDEEIVA